ncbi:hypothetical protein [Allonocardiopsis opalescens]|uniref:Lipoprotein LpqN n=1 Tax=Allonocardiopsis opalescens TaxID=1144618 RepID=A0A2T0PVH6_9ACTN|nr:hypothetical protein [Allonocardiopsis opalescens]PRX95507.1 hypothetical protein CLV72_109116 [Allonocardiopsis opalescens]
MRTTAVSATVLALGVLLAGGCSSGADPAPPAAGTAGEEAPPEAAGQVEVPEGFTPVTVDRLSFAVPEGWTETASEELESPVVGGYAGFEGDQEIARVTVLSGPTEANEDARSRGEGIMSALALEVRMDRGERGEAIVPGASSAHEVHYTYTLFDEEPPLDRRGLDLTMVNDQGTYWLLRITALAEHTNDALFDQITGSVALEG